MRSRARVAVAGALVVVGLGAPLGLMWWSGRAAAEAEHDKILAAPVEEARAAAERIAARVASELEGLAAREAERPYYQWQSLIVDPRGAYEGEAVVPSALADGPTEPLVRAHFQLDRRGRVTSPEVNEAEGAPAARPEAVARLAGLREALAGRRAVAEGGEAPAVEGVSDEGAADEGEQVAKVVEAVKFTPGRKGAKGVLEQRLDNAVYQQNAAAPELFEAIQQKRNKPVGSTASGEVTVRVGPFEWETLVVGGEEVLAATRMVETPDAPVRQGFVVDGERLAAFLVDGRVTGALAERGVESAGAVVAPLGIEGVDKVVRVALPDEAALRVAAAVPLDEFWVRSVVLTVFAVLAALAILGLVVQAERLSERRQRFAAAAAHELRTPLAGLRMYAEMLEHGLGKPERQKEYAGRLASEAARLGRVVSNVLDFTRLERRSLVVSASAQDVAALCEEIVKRHAGGVAAAGARLELVRPERAVMAKVDADALAQIVGNLIDNAEKYTRQVADRTITVTVGEGEGGPEVRVRDRGPGLGDTRRVFEPFARGKDRDAPPGLGLGLALSRALARAQGGELEARAVERGAELVLKLASAEP